MSIWTSRCKTTKPIAIWPVLNLCSMLWIQSEKKKIMYVRSNKMTSLKISTFVYNGLDKGLTSTMMMQAIKVWSVMRTICSTIPVINVTAMARISLLTIKKKGYKKIFFPCLISSSSQRDPNLLIILFMLKFSYYLVKNTMTSKGETAIKSVKARHDADYTVSPAELKSSD